MSSGKRPFINKLYLLGFVCVNLGICFAVVGWSDSVFSLGVALCYGGLFTVSIFNPFHLFLDSIIYFRARSEE